MGKNAFDVSKSSMYNFDPDDLVIIGLDTEDYDEHPLWDQRVKLPLDEKLVLNIMAIRKIINPVRIRKNGDKAEVVAGKQRVRACREANKRLKIHGYDPIMVPCILDRADDSDSMGMMVSENELRQGDSPIVRAKKIQRYIDHGHNEDEASKIFGITAQAIKMQLSLLDLDKSVQKMVEGGQLSATAASSLSSLSRDEQKAEAEKLIESGASTIKEVKHAVKKAKAKKSGGDEADVVKAPSKRHLKRLLKRNAELVDEEQLDESFIKGVRFAIGDLSAGSVKGLTAMMADEWK